MLIMKNIIKFAAAAILPVSAHASLLVEQWVGGGAGSSGLSGVDSAIAGRAATASGVYEIIDFTDDPSGFAGDIPGSVAWPYASQLGATGVSHLSNVDFAARITTMLTITAADTYSFKTYSDDGVRLKIGSNVIISDDSYHPESINFGSLFLSPGIYPLELVFFENVGEASLEFSVAQGNGPYGHVGGIGGPGTSVGVPDGGASLALLSLALGAMSVAQCSKRFGRQ